MRDNSFIFNVSILLALAIVNASLSFAAPVSAGSSVKSQPAMPRWQSTPEDLNAWKREPFKNIDRPLNNSASSGKSVSLATDFSLQGIMKSNTRFYAIINGTTVKPGNRIEGWTVAEITRHRVTLRRDKETQIFDIYQGKIDRGTR